MTGNATDTTDSAALPAWRDPAAWSRTADFIAILVVISLPWSTSLLSIFIAIWILVVSPSLEIKPFMQSLKRPVCALPIALFVLAVIGTLWSPAPWDTRLYYIGPTSKLMVLPLLIYHFERSQAGLRVLLAFLISCSILLLISWWSYFDSALVLAIEQKLRIGNGGYAPGLPVKNYITQSQEFVICAFGCAIAAVVLWRDNSKVLSVAFAFAGAAFIVNPLFVISSRTALVCVPAVAVVLAARYMNRSQALFALLGMIVIAGVAWGSSPYVRMRLDAAVTGYFEYQQSNEVNSSSDRLEFWRKSLRFVRTSPLIGHGTGSVGGLFAQDAVGQTKVSAVVTDNPHNQTFYFAVQWGLVGVTLLFAMWIAHFLIFRGIGWGYWLGTLIVAQNIVASVFNSHLSDFVEGWIYVIGVGVTAGMLFNIKSRSGSSTDFGGKNVGSAR